MRPMMIKPSFKMGTQSFVERRDCVSGKIDGHPQLISNRVNDLTQP